MNKIKMGYTTIPTHYFIHLIHCEERCNILKRMVQDDQVILDSDILAILDNENNDRKDIPSC